MDSSEENMDGGNRREADRDLEKGLALPLSQRTFQYLDLSPVPSPTSSTARPALVLSSQYLDLSPVPSPTASTPRLALVLSNSGKSLLGSNSSKSLGTSNSGKKIDKKKYVKQVTGRHNDTELHLAAQRGDLGAVKKILGEINSQMLGTANGAEFDAGVAEIRSAIVDEVNELGETPLFTAAEKGHLDVVKELLLYTTKEGISLKNRTGLDALHVAASQGHQAIVQVLLDHDPGLSKTVGQANATPLITAATKGHTAVTHELLSRDPSLLEKTKKNGKNALHFAVRQGHVDIVKALLDKDPKLARKTDKKGQTALHMAVKGVSPKVVKLILQVDPSIVTLTDKFGNTALHVATRKKRVEIVHELVRLRDTNVNALTRDNKTSLEIAEGLILSEETSEVKDLLIQYGAVRANELYQPRDELNKTVTEIKKDMHNQLKQTRKTNKNVSGIAKELLKLHREGMSNATNSVTVIASLFATVAFAAITQLPGGDNDDGTAVVRNSPPFKIFYVSNSLALFTSLVVVLVQITIVRGEIKSERRVVEVINKLMWLATIFTTVAFISAAYIVVGRHSRWAAILITIIGGVIIVGVLGAMTYHVVKNKRIRKVKKKEKHSRKDANMLHLSDADSDLDPIYAI